MIQYENPFTGSSVKVTSFKMEDEVENFESLRFGLDVQVEDENERFILFKDGLLIRKTKSEKKYFPNRFSN